MITAAGKNINHDHRITSVITGRVHGAAVLISCHYLDENWSW